MGGHSDNTIVGGSENFFPRPEKMFSGKDVKRCFRTFRGGGGGHALLLKNVQGKTNMPFHLQLLSSLLFLPLVQHAKAE